MKKKKDVLLIERVIEFYDELKEELTKDYGGEVDKHHAMLLHRYWSLKKEFNRLYEYMDQVKKELDESFDRTRKDAP